MLNPLHWVLPRTIRIGVTGLARAGKTAFLTSVAANLLAAGAGLPVLPSLAGRVRRVSLAPAGASFLPRFDHPAHLAALDADPPHWPARTNAVALLALELELAHPVLPARTLRLELLDYPGEWLLDLPLLGQDYAAWSAATLRRLEAPGRAAIARDFLAFTAALPARAPADEALAATGHALYVATLRRLRDELGLSFLQPGRFLMPPPGAPPPWSAFFPSLAGGGLGELLARRYAACQEAVRDELVSPLFGDLDRIVVLADLLSALHAGEAAFTDAKDALAAAAGALRWRGSWLEAAAALARLRLPPRVIRRVAYVATKADHVAERQRGNLRALLAAIAAPEGGGPGASPPGTRPPGAQPGTQPGTPLAGAQLLGTALLGATRLGATRLGATRLGGGAPRTASFAVAAVRCTEDFVWTLEGHPVSAVRGRRLGEARMTRSYPGEVPDRPPDAAFWAHPFLSLPSFEPMRLPGGGRAGVANLGLDALLAFLLEDLL